MTTAASSTGRRKRVTSLEPVRRLALTPQEAADSLGISRDSFDDYVKPELRVIRRGNLVMVPVVELEKWIAREAALTLETQ